jgi:cyclic dehypoxanthinyl futalosine synthase
MMEENVVSKAGTSFRLQVEEIERLIREAGYEARRRNTWYELISAADTGREVGVG